MGKRLSADERELIDELYEQGYKPPEIAVKVSRDTRTVKHYLNERPRERSVELERQQQELEHRNDIRRRIDNLKNRLEFPSPMYLWIPDDPKTGNPITKVGISLHGDTIEWELGSSGYVIKLDEGFDPVIEHLYSSRRRAVLGELDRWKQLGGKCAESCHRLRLWIEREAKDRTGLDKVPDTGQRGLRDGFCLSVYRSVFFSEDFCEKPYNIASTCDDLHLLTYANLDNLAWLGKYEIDKIRNVHQRLITTCQNLSITIEIRQAIAELKQITSSLHRRLDDFASLRILPGKCRLCPSD